MCIRDSVSTLEDRGVYRTYPSLTSLSVTPSSSSGSTTTTLLFPVTTSAGVGVEDGGRIARHIEAFLCLYDEVSLMVQATSNILFAPPESPPLTTSTTHKETEPAQVSQPVLVTSADPQPPLPIADETTEEAKPDIAVDANTITAVDDEEDDTVIVLSLIHISEPTRLLSISYAVFCLKKKKKIIQDTTNAYTLK
eukprot:TRINITY_DN7191_c0_g2_i2.p1 TRINITY_DN7191_c0_g2~~TRINITY_DN7191_c0_g2_i2.p1  ORF type:complete len:195 (-),score=53.85 TRINITY_DN7191_c0_g2_i2:48-632(-)